MMKLSEKFQAMMETFPEFNSCASPEFKKLKARHIEKLEHLACFITKLIRNWEERTQFVLRREAKIYFISLQRLNP